MTVCGIASGSGGFDLRDNRMCHVASIGYLTLRDGIDGDASISRSMPMQPRSLESS